jgi:translocation protein SEC63
MAKTLHPDNNSGDPEATSKFQLVNKAMRCLTDPEVMEKCKKFGNPDGGSGFQVGIALPKALLDKNNKMFILSLFFLIVLIILPSIVWLWYTEKEKYAEHGVTKESIHQSLFFLRNENLTVNNVLEMCSSSVELKSVFGTKVGQGMHLSTVILIYFDSFFSKIISLNHSLSQRLNLLCQLTDVFTSNHTIWYRLT